MLPKGGQERSKGPAPGESAADPGQRSAPSDLSASVRLVPFVRSGFRPCRPPVTRARISDRPALTASRASALLAPSAVPFRSPEPRSGSCVSGFPAPPISLAPFGATYRISRGKRDYRTPIGASQFPKSGFRAVSPRWLWLARVCCGNRSTPPRNGEGYQNPLPDAGRGQGVGSSPD